MSHQDKTADDVTSSPKSTGAELVIVKLNSLEREEVHRNAEKKTIHSIVKVLPFTIDLALRGQFDPYVVDFHKFTLQSTLLYDTPDERVVDWVKSSPIDCVVQVNETGERAMAEVRLHVLSSQHEDLAFRIKFAALPPAARANELLPLSVVSDPIKVVSKQSQLKKNKKKQTVRGTKRQRASGASTPQTPATPSILPGLTVGAEVDDEHRARLIESLARIEAQQREQQQLINSIVQTVAVLQQQQQAGSTVALRTNASPAVADVGSPQSPSQHAFHEDYDSAEPLRKRVKLEEGGSTQMEQRGGSQAGTPVEPRLSPHDDDATRLFERHLSGLLHSFAQLPPEDRGSSIRRVFRDDAMRASEVVEALLAESLVPKYDGEENDSHSLTADLSNFEPLTYDHVPLTSARAMPPATTEEPSLYQRHRLQPHLALRPQGRYGHSHADSASRTAPAADH